MICPKCGSQMPDDSKFCSFCGTDFSMGEQPVNNYDGSNDNGSYNNSSNDNGSYNNSSYNNGSYDNGSYNNGSYDNGSYNNGSYNNNGYNNGSYGNGSYNGGGYNPNGGSIPMNMRLKEDRDLLSYILFALLTCGIYSYYFIYQMAHDVNIACEGDGEETSGLVAFIVLSIVTCGIYSFYWQYKLGNRLAANAARYGMSFQENGTSVLIWDLFGAMLCGIGPFIAMNILIKNSNYICAAYNRAHGV